MDGVRDRSPIDETKEEIKDRERNRDRSRRGDRPSRFGPRSLSREREGDRSTTKKGSASDRRIFVSNIAYEYRWQELKDLFRNEVGEVAYVELFTDENDKFRGCGIVEFESPESVKKAVEKMHRYELKGRKLVVKEDFESERDKFGRLQKNQGGGGGGGSGVVGINRMRDEQRKFRDMGPPTGANNQNKWGNTYGLSPQFLESLWINGPLGTKVFVANLDYKVDEKKLREVFKLAGKVVSAEINVDKEGKSRGFGVVEYDHPVEAVQAISMLHNQVLYDRKLAVRMDRVDQKPDGPPKLPEGLRGIGMGLGTNGLPLTDVARNLPSGGLGQVSGLGTIPATGIGAGLNAAALTGVVNPQLAAAASLSGGLAAAAGVGGLGAGLLGTTLGAGGDIGLGAGLGAAAFGSNALGAASLGAAATNLQSALGAANADRFAGLAANSYGASGLGGNTGNQSLFSGGGGAGGGYSGGSASNITSGFNNSSNNRDFGNTGRDFDSMSAALSGSAGYNAAGERDYRSGSGTARYSNGPSDRNAGGGGSGATGTIARPSDTILIKNLPPSTTWQMLRDKFREIGDVKFAEMRGKDLGLIRFSSEWDAERAVHMMDRTRIDGRIIDVCLFY